MPGPTAQIDSTATSLLRAWREEADSLDVAVYAAVAATPTPAMDVGLRRLSRAADHSKLWLGCAALLATFGGERGRAAAADGLASIALTSPVVNLVLKRLGGRRRFARRLLARPHRRALPVRLDRRDRQRRRAGARRRRRAPAATSDLLTDRRRLYRVLEIVPAKLRKRAAILEDCETLDATLFRPRELRRMRLQLVERAPAPS
jgi:hypothetical protein